MARFNVKQSVQSARAAAGAVAPGTDEKPPAKRSAAKKATPKRQAQPKATPESAAPTKPAEPVTDDIGAPLPGETTPARPQKNSRRVAVPLPDDMRRELARARIDDDVETTVRIRAMIELWSTDKRIRARVDKLARQRSTELIAHRWPAG